MRLPATPEPSQQELLPLSQLRSHPDGDLVPAMSEGEYPAFLSDISERGILVPLEITPERLLLDGRQRLRAAHDLNLPSVPVRVVEVTDSIAYMLLAALRRRDLNASQKAALALDLDRVQDARAAAHARKTAGTKQEGDLGATLPQARTRDIAAQLAGVSARTVQDALTVHTHDPQLFERVKNGEIAADRARMQISRRLRDAQLPPAPPMPDGPFQIVYADPPWQLGNPDSPNAPEQHYPTMPLREIADMKIPAADDALLYLWAVNALLPEALQTIQAWGFTYKTYIAWVKNSIGPGVWTRPCSELLLLARRGTYPPPDEHDRPAGVIHAPRRTHSQKPDEAYELIERSYPHATRVELFARTTRPGWTSWGNQLPPQESTP